MYERGDQRKNTIDTNMGHPEITEPWSVCANTCKSETKTATARGYP